MPENRDLRNESRRWQTMPMQDLLDIGLNVFGLELFVESYWNVIAVALAGGKAPEEITKQEFMFRGMKITLSPREGLEEAGILEPLPPTGDTK